ncbi:hypothetical protein KAW50_03630 [candidate division WOR-3 bacterium]|nr:hypothetical protein [candidate division WOR-3 bacterium]
MIKIICDICGHDIKESELQGGFMLEKWIFPIMDPKVSPMPGMKQKGKDVQTLCEECATLVADEIKNLKKKKTKKE